MKRLKSAGRKSLPFHFWNESNNW